MLDIDGYVPLKAPVSGIVHDLSRSDARAVYQNVLDSIPDRLSLLRSLCERNGYRNDPGGWTKLLADHVETEVDEDGRVSLHPVIKTVVLDISLAMSQRLIDRSNGQLTWKFYTGSKRSLDFQRSVLVGFSKAAKSYQLHLFRPLTNMALTAANGEPMRDLSQYLEMLAEDI